MGLIHVAYEMNLAAKKIVSALKNMNISRWPTSIRRLIRKDKVDFKLVNGLAYFRDRLFVPDHDKLRLEVVYRTHSSGPGGHPGRVKSLDLLQRCYWWPGMSKFVTEFVKGCALCLRTKTPRASPPGFLKPLKVPCRAWVNI